MQNRGPIGSFAGCVPVKLSSYDAQPQIMLVKIQKPIKNFFGFKRKSDTMRNSNHSSITNLSLGSFYDDFYHIEWAIPRGKIRRRESAEETALREAKKQMGLTGIITDYLGDFYHSGEHVVIKTFVMNVCDKQNWSVKDSTKIRRWFTFPEASTVMLGPILSEMLKRLQLLHYQHMLVRSVSPNSFNFLTGQNVIHHRAESPEEFELSGVSSSNSSISFPPGNSLNRLPVFKTFFVDYENDDQGFIRPRLSSFEDSQKSPLYSPSSRSFFAGSLSNSSHASLSSSSSVSSSLLQLV
eukprot:Sdes_comp20689_c1_seq1m16226